MAASLTAWVTNPMVAPSNEIENSGGRQLRRGKIGPILDVEVEEADGTSSGDDL